MTSVKYRRFTKTLFLMMVERGLLDEFLQQFRDDLAARGLPLPDRSLPDDEYFRAASRLLILPESLPDSLNDALCAVEEMATDQGRERLVPAAAEAGIEFREDSSDVDCAILAWLRLPTVFSQQRAELDTTRMTAFEYFGAARPVPTPRPFAPPTEEQLSRLATAIDPWYAAHQQAADTTLVEAFPNDGEWWFVVRHGTCYARMRATERRHRRVIHFRPDRDEVVIYSPSLNELRIHARTAGERRMLREVFGYYLFGDPGYFSPDTTYTLTPLQELRQAVLDPAGIPGIRDIVLTEVEFETDPVLEHTEHHKARDLLARAKGAKDSAELFPPGCRLTKAVFRFRFEGWSQSCRVTVRLPGTVKMPRGCPADLVHRWLSVRRFRVAGAARNEGKSNVA